MRYAIIRDGVIENFVEWDGTSAWTAPGGTQLAPCERAAGIGWQWNGGNPVDPNPPQSRPRVYTEATAAGIIRALHARGLLDQVDAAVAQADALTQRLWARTSIFHRSDPLLLAIADTLGMTDQLDALFTEANS